MIKTSKIKEVHKMTPWNGPNGTIIYHWLLMENDDLIDIGKKKECKVGWDITYRITDTQHKYHKAKAEQPEQGTPAAEAIQENIKRKDDNLKGIKIGHAITNAVHLCSADLARTPEKWPIDNVLQGMIKDYAKMILKIADELDNEPKKERPNTTSTLKDDNDLPF